MQLQALQDLQLYGCFLTALPESIGQLEAAAALGQPMNSKAESCQRISNLRCVTVVPKEYLLLVLEILAHGPWLVPPWPFVPWPLGPLALGPFSGWDTNHPPLGSGGRMERLCQKLSKGG